MVDRSRCPKSVNDDPPTSSTINAPFEGLIVGQANIILSSICLLYLAEREGLRLWLLNHSNINRLWI